jgi:CheY-like chemotaxis protein
MRVLFADDDDNIRIILKDYLEAFGFKVFLAENGVQAFQRVQDENPDLLILDMAMPEMDGWEVAKKIREMPRSTPLPILALTAHVLANAGAKALEAGCDAYLTKPFRPADVLAEVRRLLGLG